MKLTNRSKRYLLAEKHKINIIDKLSIFEQLAIVASPKQYIVIYTDNLGTFLTHTNNPKRYANINKGKNTVIDINKAKEYITNKHK